MHFQVCEVLLVLSIAILDILDSGVSGPREGAAFAMAIDSKGFSPYIGERWITEDRLSHQFRQI